MEEEGNKQEMNSLFTSQVTVLAEPSDVLPSLVG